MALRLPPGDCAGTPAKTVLTAGIVLWRVHRRKFAPDSFNRTPIDPDKRGGGRFDCTSERFYPYLYAAPDESTALAETLLRDLPFDDRGRRLLPRARIAGRRLSAVELTGDVKLLRLVDSTDLAGICADESLLHAEPLKYDLTRRWACWLHERQSWAQGLEWQSKRDLTRRCVMLFGDRFDLLKPLPEAGFDLDDHSLLGRLNGYLAPYGAHVNPARRS